MRIIELALPGVYLVEPEIFPDDRGLFTCTFSKEAFEKEGLHGDFVQANMSSNARAGTLRGLHFQWPPHDEVKLLRCVRGRIYDVAVDIRRGSETFGCWFGMELAAAQPRTLYVPRGFAHGYQALEDGSEVSYLTSATYAPSHTGGVRWDDPTLAIDWPIRPPVIMSERDRSLPLLADLDLPTFDRG